MPWRRTTPSNPPSRPELVGSGGSISNSVSVSDFRVSVKCSIHKAEAVTSITGQYYVYSHELQATLPPPTILGNDRFWSHPSSVGGGSSGIEDLSRPVLLYLSTPTTVYSAVLIFFLITPFVFVWQISRAVICLGSAKTGPCPCGSSIRYSLVQPRISIYFPSCLGPVCRYL